MKQFACGDVIPGCEVTFTGESVKDILEQVVAHAAEAHGLSDLRQALIDAVTPDSN